MATAAKVAMAVGAGYLLGRTRKMRLALMLAGAGITGKFPARPSDLVAHGLKSLGGSEQLTQLTGQLRGELLDAAKAAALTAATSQVDALNDRLQGVLSTAGADEVLEDVGGTVGGVGETVGGVGETVGGVGEPVLSAVGLGGRRRADRRGIDADDEVYADEEPFDVDADEDEEPLDLEEDEDLDEPLDEAEPDEEPEPPRPRRRAARQPVAARSAQRRATRAVSDDSSTRAARRRPTASATGRAPVRGR